MKSLLKWVSLIGMALTAFAMSAFADALPGSPVYGSNSFSATAVAPLTFSFTIHEGIDYILPELVVPGDLVLCEGSGAPRLNCGGANPGQSDIVHFFTVGGVSHVIEYTPLREMGDGDPNDVLWPFGSDAFGNAINLTNPVVFNETVNEGGDEIFIYRAAGNVYTIYSDEAPIPEPSTLLLLGSGLLGVAAKVRRRFLS